jgi:hypothetical protein
LKEGNSILEERIRELSHENETIFQEKEKQIQKIQEYIDQFKKEAETQSE